MSTEYAGQLFETESARCRCIAMEWLTAGGLNDPKTVSGWLDTVSPDTFAAECLDGWFSRDLESERPDPAELTAAFSELAENREWLKQ